MVPVSKELAPLAAKLRGTAFWSLDRIRGGSIRRAVDDVALHANAPHGQAARRLHQDRLCQILSHASTTVAAFRGASPDDLRSYPVTNKNVIRANESAFISADYRDKQLRRVVTSGSTGTPFVSYRDATKATRNSADTIAFGRAAGYDVGAPVAYFTVWPKRRGLAAIKPRLQNVSPVDVTRMTVEQSMELARRFQRLGSGVNLIGYASAIEDFCLNLQEFGIQMPPGSIRSVTTMSETPSARLFALSARVLGSQVAVRYSNMENGILAQQNPGSAFYQLNTASYHVELLEFDANEPVTPGSPGRIVVTDLFNRAMPFIRYDTGDVGISYVDTEGRVDMTRLAHIEGRRSDLIYDADNALLSTHFVAKVMNAYVDVRQYQLIQTAQGAYTVRLNAREDPARDERIAADFKRELGPRSRLTIEHTDEIPLLSSGKRRRIVNEWSPDRDR